MSLEENKAKDKERKQDEQDVNDIKQESGKSSKKIKNPFVMILRKMAALIAAIPIIIKIIIIVFIASVISLALAWIHDTFSSHTVADVASERIIQEEVETDQKGDFGGLAIGSTDGDGMVVKVKDLGHYFKLSKEAQERYLEELNKSYIQGYYSMTKKDESEVKSRDEANLLYDPQDVEFNIKNVGKWFETEEFKDYFVKMIKAEIESSSPKLSDYQGDGGYNPTDGNGDYVIQGIGKLGRITIDDNGNPSKDTYRMYHMPYDDFKNFIAQCNSEQKDDALYYFSYVPEEQAIYYATETKIITEVNGAVVSTQLIYELAGPFSYESVVSLCAMPYNYLFTLLQTSENPEWIMEVVKLLEQSKIHIIIQDGLTITKNTEITDKATKTVTTVSDGSTSTTSTDVTYPSSTTETIVTTYRRPATVYIKNAETWCVDLNAAASQKKTEYPPIEQSYSYDNVESLCTNLISTDSQTSSINDTNTTNETNTTNTLTQTITITTVTEVYESDDLLRYTKEECTEYTWTINSLNKINYTRFLGTWRNKSGTVGGGEYDPNGIEVKYKIPDENVETAIPPDNISDDTHQNINLLVELLRLNDNTQMHEMLMRYYWNVYNDKYIYDIDMDDLMNFFNTDIFELSQGKFLSGTMIENYIKAWENDEILDYEAGISSLPPSKYMTDDGLYYIVHEDGSNGHNNISYGIATFITNPDNVKVIHPKFGGGYYNWESNFSSRGIDVTTLDTGSLVPKDIADAVYLEILEGFETKVDNYLSTHGLNLTQCQRDALVAICYQYGNINGFKEAYDKSLDENGNIDPEAIKENFILTSNDNAKPFNYSSTKDRKYANWSLFTKDIYIDRSGKEIKALGGSILQCAKQIHDYMSDPAHLYYYCLADPGGPNEENERWKHEQAGLRCGLNPSFEASQIKGNRGYRLTCCATYVSWVLEAAGYLNEHTDGAADLGAKLQAIGWKKINTNDWRELQPGDVTIHPHHTQLYVGDGYWYNAGGNSSIQRVEPYYSDYTRV